MKYPVFKNIHCLTLYKRKCYILLIIYLSNTVYLEVSYHFLYLTVNLYDSFKNLIPL